MPSRREEGQNDCWHDNAAWLAGHCHPGVYHRGARSEEDFPSRPVRLVVPTAPGSGVDIMSRVFADSMARQTGRSFVVDNRVGAASAVGTQYVARQHVGHGPPPLQAFRPSERRAALRRAKREGGHHQRSALPAARMPTSDRRFRPVDPLGEVASTSRRCLRLPSSPALRPDGRVSWHRGSHLADG